MPGTERKVWRLRKALYGLKQAGREWNLEIDGFLRSLGLHVVEGDRCLYYSIVANSLLLICLYVDDILVAHESAEVCEQMMKTLFAKYQIKGMGEPRQFLGINVERIGKHEIRLSQTKYIDEVLHRFEMENSKSTRAPMVPNTRLDLDILDYDEEERAEMRNVPYRSAVGALLYLARVSRPDIGFAVNQLARHNSNPRRDAWKAAKYLMRYLAGTRDACMVIKPNDNGIRVTSDADWGNDIVDRQSISGYVIYLHGCPVSWCAKKQSIVACSSTAAEYIAADLAVEQAEYIQIMVNDVMSAMNKKISMVLEMDSLSGIARIRRNGLSETQKTVDIRYKKTKKLINDGGAELRYLRTDDMPADILTKSLAATSFHHKRQLCGVQLEQVEDRLSTGGEVLDPEPRCQTPSQKMEGCRSCDNKRRTNGECKIYGRADLRG